MSSSTASRRSWRYKTKEPTSKPIRLIQALFLLAVVAALIWIVVVLIFGRKMATTHWFSAISVNYQGLEFPPIEFHNNDLEAFDYLDRSSLVKVRPFEITENWNQVINALNSEFSEDAVDPRRDVAIIYLSAEGFVDANGNAYLADPNLLSLESVGASQISVRDLLSTISKLPCKTKLVLLDAGQIRFDLFRGLSENTFSAQLKQILADLQDDSLWLICSHDTRTQQSYASYADRQTIFNLAVVNAINHCADDDDDDRVTLDKFYRRMLNYCGSMVRIMDDSRNAVILQAPILYRGGHGFVSAREYDSLASDIVLFDKFSEFPRDDSSDNATDSAGKTDHRRRSTLAGLGRSLVVIGGSSLASLETGRTIPLWPSTSSTGQPLQEPSDNQQPTADDEPPTTDELVSELMQHELFQGGGEDRAAWQDLVDAWRLRDELQQRKFTQSPIDYAPNLWHRLNLNLSHLDRRLRGGSTTGVKPILNDIVAKLRMLRNQDTSSADTATVNPEVQDHLLKSYRSMRGFSLLRNFDEISSEQERNELAQYIRDFQDAIFRCQFYVDWVDDVAAFYPDHQAAVEDLLVQINRAKDAVARREISFKSNSIATDMTQVRNAEARAFQQIVDAWLDVRQDVLATPFKKEQIYAALLKNPLVGVLPHPTDNGDTKLTRLAVIRDWADLMVAQRQPLDVKSNQPWPVEPGFLPIKHQLRKQLLQLGSPDQTETDSETLIQLVNDDRTPQHSRWLAATVLDPRCWEDNPIDHIDVSYSVIETTKFGQAQIANAGPIKMWNLAENVDLIIELATGTGDVFNGTARFTYDADQLEISANGRTIAPGTETSAFTVDRNRNHTLSVQLSATAMRDAATTVPVNVVLLDERGTAGQSEELLVQLPITDQLNLKIGQNSYNESRVIPQNVFNDTISYDDFIRIWTLPNADTQFVFQLQNRSGRSKQLTADLYSVDLKKPETLMPGRITLKSPNFKLVPDDKDLEEIRDKISGQDDRSVAHLATSQTWTLSDGDMQPIAWQLPDASASDESGEAAEPPKQMPTHSIGNGLVCVVRQTEPDPKEYFFFIELFPIGGANLIQFEASYDRNANRFQLDVQRVPGTAIGELSISVDPSDQIGAKQAESIVLDEQKSRGMLSQNIPESDGDGQFFRIGININGAPRQLRFIIDRNKDGLGAVAQTTDPHVSISKIYVPVVGEENAGFPEDTSIFNLPDSIRMDLKVDNDPEADSGPSGSVLLAVTNTDGGSPWEQRWPNDREISLNATLVKDDSRFLQVRSTIADRSAELKDIPRNAICNVQVQIGGQSIEAFTRRRIVFDTLPPPRPPSVELPDYRSYPNKELKPTRLVADDYPNGSEIQLIRVNKRSRNQRFEDVEPYEREYKGLSTNLDLVFDKVGEFVVQFQSVDKAGNESGWSDEIDIIIEPEPEMTDPKSEPDTFIVVLNVSLGSRAFPRQDGSAFYDLEITGPQSYSKKNLREPSHRLEVLLPEGEYEIKATGRDQRYREIEISSGDKLIVNKEASDSDVITHQINLDRPEDDD